MPNKKSPFLRFSEIVSKNSPVSRKRYNRLFAFYFKMLPTRFLSFIENIFYKKKLKGYEPKKPPIYVLGHWRSGTSFLQSLLGASPQFVFHTKFQTFFPESFLVTEKTIKQPATSILQQVGLIDSSEIEISMLNQAKPYSFHWGQVFPKSWKHYFDKYLFWDTISDEEAEQWNRNVKYLNKKVNFVNPDKQLLVKNPGDTARAKAILNLYPDVKFVFVHRNPYDVYYSSVKLWKKILNNLSLQEITLEEIKEAIIYTYKRVHEKYINDKALIPEGNLVEISYEELKDNPLQTMKVIYEELGLKDFEKDKPSLHKYLEGISHTPTDYKYKTKDLERIHDQWEFMFKHFNYPMLHLKGNSQRLVG